MFPCHNRCNHLIMPTSPKSLFAIPPFHDSCVLLRRYSSFRTTYFILPRRGVCEGAHHDENDLESKTGVAARAIKDSEDDCFGTDAMVQPLLIRSIADFLPFTVVQTVP